MSITINGTGSYETIQAAIDAASTGDTISISAGTYTGNIVIDVENLTIVAEEGAVLQGTFRADNTGSNPATSIGADESVADYLFRTTAYSGASGAGVTIQADGVTIQTLEVRGYNTGIELGNGTDGASLTDMTITETVVGIRKGSGAAVTDLTVTGGEITDSSFGIYIAKESAAGLDLDGLTITGTSFSDLTQKGIYVETLSDATISGITMTDVGELGRGPAFGGTLVNGNLGGFGGGIDINLKWDHDGVDSSYSNITIEDFTFTNVGVSNGGVEGAPSHFGGAAIAIKARDDAPSYSSPESASYSGSVVVQNGTIDGTSVGIRVGEPNKANADANVTGPSVEVSGVEVSNATVADANNVSKSSLTFEMEEGDTTFVAQDGATSTGAIDVTGTDGNDSITTASGDDTIDGGAGDDAIDGGSGIDTAVYSGTVTVATADGGWTVTAGDAGTDTLSNVEIVNDGAGGKTLLVGNGGYETIQAALADAEAGDTIQIAEGTYTGNIVIDVENLTIVAEEGAVLQGTFRADNTGSNPATSIGADESVADYLFRTTAYSGASGAGITIQADGVTIQNLEVRGYLTGVSLGDSSDVNLTDMTITETVNGIYKGDSATVDGLTVTDGEITDSSFGVYFAKVAVDSGDIDNVTITGTSFSHLTQKGIYVETLSDALITGITMTDVGVLGRGPAFGGTLVNGNLGGFGAGIDINLKWDHEGEDASYSNIKIDGFTFTNVGTSNGGVEGAPSHFGGAAIAIKARDDAPTYSSEGASYDGPVIVQNGTIDGTSVGIRVGEPNKANSAANVTGPDVEVSGVEITNATVADANNVSKSVLTVEMDDGDTTFVAQDGATSTGAIDVTGTDGNDSITTASGDDTIDGGAGDDAIDGGSGIDTAVYSGTVTVAAADGGWTVTAGDESTDTLTNVEIVNDGEAGQILLVGEGGFATIQEAVDAASAGDTILVAAGEYTGNVVIDKAVTLRGANAGLDGNDGERGAESVIVGKIDVTASAAVTIDGFEVRNTGATSGGGPSNPALWFATGGSGDGHLVTNTVFNSIVAGGANGVDDRAIGMGPIATGTVRIEDNLFTGTEAGKYGTASWGRGIWSDGGGVTLSITGNEFEYTRSAINYDGPDGASSPQLTIEGNTFGVAGTAMSFAAGGDVTGITGNTFNDVDTDFNFQNITNSVTLDLGETENLPTDGQPMVVLGGSAADVITGSAGTDVLQGNGGADTLEGAGGNDTITGGGGIDTAVYDQSMDASMITGNGSGGWTVTTGGAEGTDTLSAVEQVDGAEGGQILLVGNGGYATIQAAIDASADGDTILIADATYTEALTISGKAITLQAAGENVVVQAPAGTNAITLTGDFEGGSVSILGITVAGAAALPNQGIGVYVTEDADIGTLTLDGLEVRDAGSYGLYVEGDNESGAAPTGVSVANLVVTNSGFSHNGYNGANGSSHIKLFNFSGNALIQDVTIEGSAPSTAVELRPDYGIELTGTRNGALAGGAVAMGTVTLAGITMTGWLHKNGLAIFNYADIDRLTVDGVDLSGVVTSWGPVLNIDGILGDIDASVFDILLPTGAIATELQGDKSVQVVTDQTITGTDAEDRLIGKGGDDQLFGGAGDDDLYGHDKDGGGYVGDAGNDLLDGGTGADTMAGGLGNDTYVVDDEGDAVTEAADAGIDTVESSIDYTLGDNLENLTLTGDAVVGTGNGLANTIVGNEQDNELNGEAGDDVLEGGEGLDTLSGGTGNDVLRGDDGDDLLLGSTGDDVLDGGSGIDSMRGGTGNDTYVVDDADDSILESANQGIDTVEASIGWTLGSNLENLTLTGTDNIDGTGNGLGNVLIGNAGANVLDGGEGADEMAGGLGDDTYVVDDAGDMVMEDASAGTDLVRASLSYTLSAHVENLVLTGDGNIDGTGNALDNALTGNSGNNTLDGAAGADTMAGGAGDDTYVVDNLLDAVTEESGQGTDTVRSSVDWTLGNHVENLTLTGTDDVDGTGNALANTLTGNSGDNVLDGGAGADTMAGGLGDDTYVVDNTGDVVTEDADAGTDLVRASVSYTLSANVENLILIGTGNINGTGNALDNALTGNAGNNQLNGGAGADTMAGGLGNDTYIVDNAGDVVTEDVDAGTDLVRAAVSYTLSANVENLTLTGSQSIDGTGNDLANLLTGNSGKNLLDGGAGADTMVGGQGNDTYVVDNAGDVVTEGANGGSDLVQASVSYTLSADVENLTLTGSGNIDGTGNSLKNTLIGNSGNNVLDGGAGADTMRGGAGNDTYVVDVAGDIVAESESEGTDTVLSAVTWTLGNNLENLTLTGSDAINGTGNTLDNALVGNAGNNVLDGRGGADTMAGGLGDDTYVVNVIDDLVTEDADAGTDLVQASVSYALSANVENLTLTGSNVINGTGNDLANVLTGNAKANILDGGAGADTMAGAAGNDTYVVDDVADAVVEQAGQGTDLVQSTASYTLSANVENLTLMGNGNIDGTGNELVNVLTGNSGNNVLDGGAGADTMAGGLGDDTYVVDNARDTVTEGADAGTDLVRASVTYTLTANVENLILTGTGNVNGTGNALANALTGNSGNNTLDGGAGADAMAGGAGNDIYVVDDVGDVVTEDADAGTDLVQASVSFGLSADVENLTLTGTANIDATGNALANALIGNSGNNVLDGGAGGDTLKGGAGDDTYVVDDVADTVTEVANQGTDTVMSSVNWTLGGSLENLTLTGSGDINGTGNDLANVLIGNAGNNVLSGGKGADTMAGGLGDDTYVVENAGDVVTELADGGTDLVRSTISYSLSANVENLTLLNSANIDATGNDLANVLTGNSGNNVLDGGAGADTMAGGVGNDTYVVDDVYDVVSEGVNKGTDLVQSSASSYTLAANVENLTLTGTGNIDGAGNELANVLTGNAGNNVLTGGDGNDTINGGGGADTASYAQSIDASMISTNGSGGWTVTTGGAEGTDMLSGVEKVDGAEGGQILLVGNGGYASIQEAVDAASAGDTILVAAGEYTGNVVIDKAVTLRGANAGLDGNDGERGAESVIVGKIDVTASAAVTIDGFEVRNTGATSGGGPSNPALWFATGGSGDGHLVTNTVFNSIVAGGANGVDDRAIGMGPIATGTVRIEDNLFTGTEAGKYGTASWGRGIWSDGGGVTLSITGNEFEYTRSAINYDGPDGASSPQLTIEGNTFGVAGTAMSFAAGGDVTGITGNTFNDVDTDFNFQNITNSVTLDLGETENLPTDGQPMVVLGGSAADVITGSAGTDVLQGNGGADTLEGGAGDDSLLGGAGDDMLDGGTGADAMAGGADNDTYVVDNAGDVVTEAASAGTDLVQSSVDFVLGDNIENLTLTGAAIAGTGNALDNTIVGNAQDNELDGAGGVDAMLGGLGNDTYLVDNVGDTVTEEAGEGTDLVRASVSYTLSANVENLTLTGVGNVDGTGNDAANVLTGNAGNNVLDGLGGVDTMAGGLGDDIYVVDDSSDLVTEEEGEGTDLVRSSASYTLTANVENLMLTGSADIDGTGNDLANAMSGNDGANLLDGGAGADTMAGGLGNDTYIVDNAGDVVTEDASAGTDTVHSSISYALGLNVENLTLTGDAIYGTGNDAANVITGNLQDNELDGGSGDDILDGGAGGDTLTGGIGNDTLDGGSGADLMIGGSGNDTYYVDDAGDIVSESGGPGIDTVFASVNYTLGSNVEHLTLTGEGNLNGTGNGLANTITGNAGNNQINGGLGNDTLTGGSGNDSFVFNTALNAATNVDQITDFGVGNDVFNLAHSVFTQISAGALAESAFHVGASATDANQRIIYDQTSGHVMYDADGSGGGAAVQFASVTAGTLLTHDDFFII